MTDNTGELLDDRSVCDSVIRIIQAGSLCTQGTLSCLPKFELMDADTRILTLFMVLY